MDAVKKISWQINLIFLIVFAGVFFYVYYRASHISFTHDESLSFTIVKGNEGLKNTANHHVLNTWLMSICSHLFGDSELSLRLPNVIAFLLYLTACYRLFNMAGQVVALFVGIPLLLFNSYLLDFFSLARGYGLSMGLMMLSLYFFLRRDIKNHTDKTILYDFILTMVFAWLALWANLNMVNFYIGIFTLSVSQYFMYARVNKKGAKKRLLFVLLCLITLAALFPPVQRLLMLKETNQLYYGADKLDDSLIMLVVLTFDFSSCPPCGGYLRTIIKVAFIAIGIYVIYKRNFTGPLSKLFLLLGLIFLGLLAEHYFFKALYPLNRTSVYLIPLYALCVYYFFTDIMENAAPIVKKISVVAEALIVCLPITYFFITTLKKNFVNEWMYDAHTKEVIEILKNKIPPNGRLVMVNNWLFDPSLNYYVESQQLNIETHKMLAPAYGKFVYEFSENFKDSGWKEIVRYDDIGTSLYEREKR